MRYMAIDYGLKRIGLAVCDPGENFVSPLCQIEATPKQPELLISRVAKIIEENGVEALIVGLPFNMDGTEGPQAKITQKFAKLLAENFTLPIELQDERLSSAAADELLAGTDFTNKRKKARRDMLAACDILQEFLNRKHA